MPTNKSPAQALFDEVVKQSVTSVLKPIGFRKSALSFHRRINDVVQVVNIQSSHGSTWEEKNFYINVGIAFDAVCHLAGETILEKPKEHDCVSRGTRDRLENLIGELPDHWSIGVNDDIEPVAEKLKASIEHLVAELKVVDCIQAYRTHRWFERFRPKRENAQIFYCLGELDEAWSEVKNMCELFADRQQINRPDWWVKELGLVHLAARCDT